MSSLNSLLYHTNKPISLIKLCCSLCHSAINDDDDDDDNPQSKPFKLVRCSDPLPLLR